MPTERESYRRLAARLAVELAPDPMNAGQLRLLESAAMEVVDRELRNRSGERVSDKVKARVIEEVTRMKRS